MSPGYSVLSPTVSHAVQHLLGRPPVLRAWEALLLPKHYQALGRRGGVRRSGGGGEGGGGGGAGGVEGGA